MSDTVPLTLHLDYAHGLGAGAPYFEALTEGRALASQCTACNKAWFPPRPSCPDHGAVDQWVELSGTGVLLSVTHTTAKLPFTDGPAEPVTFAMIAMEGAENAVFGRLAGDVNEARPGQAVHLTASGDDAPHPAQAAVFTVAS